MTNYEWISVTVLGLIVSTLVLILLLEQLQLLAQQVKDAREAIDFSATEAEAENRPAVSAQQWTSSPQP